MTQFIGVAAPKCGAWIVQDQSRLLGVMLGPGFDLMLNPDGFIRSFIGGLP
jgi:hypothetical protein